MGYVLTPLVPHTDTLMTPMQPHCNPSTPYVPESTPFLPHLDTMQNGVSTYRVYPVITYIYDVKLQHGVEKC